MKRSTEGIATITGAQPQRKVGPAHRLHSNTVEGCFSILKRYLSEFDFRYSTRELADADRAEELLRGAKGKRLMYRQPDEAAHT